MKTRLYAIGVILLVAGIPAAAHRLDEYLQATLISVDKDRVQAQVRLTPGVAVFPIVLANIDTDGDGVISEDERRAYAEQVRRDLSLTIDGDPIPLRLISTKFAGLEDMKEGSGEIQFEFDATLPSNGPNRTLIFENHHQSRIGAYLVNCLVPRDPNIRVTAQSRNYQQSFYRLDYLESGVRVGPLSLHWWSGGRGLVGAIALVLFARLAWLWRDRHDRFRCGTGGQQPCVNYRAR